MRHGTLGLTTFIVLTILSCGKQATKDTVGMTSINQITSDYDSLIYNVKVHGDTNAYDELFYGFIDANEIERTDSVLRYSKIMATNFRYEKAYYDYLTALCEKNGIDTDFYPLSKLDLTNQDEQTKKVIIEWLQQMLQDKVITQEEFNSVK